MRLFELFADNVDIVGDLRAQLLDILVPLAGSGIRYTTVDQVIDKLRSLDSGVRIDRNLVMKLLDPAEVALVKSIEGDRVNFTVLSPPSSAKAEEDTQRGIEKIKTTAEKQAQKDLKS